MARRQGGAIVSETKRYDLYLEHRFQAEEGGEWVKWEDYAALQAENERLRKAGDAVIEKLAEAYAGDVSEFDHAHVFKAWRAAKEVQS